MQHPYLSNSVCTDRLLAWHRQNGKIIVAYDFDNTVYDYHGAGHDYSEVIELIKRAHRLGCYLIVFTGNADEQLVRSFLKEKGIPYDTINEHAPFLPICMRRARKIYYNVLLDDAAGLGSAYAYLDSFLDTL
jgi:predicted HAD superfamily phosphohydrolase YqeG